jgi:hypothetical protein
MGRARVILAAVVGHDVLIGEQRSKKGYRPAFIITLNSHMDLDLTLHALYPYLVGKWQQAFIVLDFLSIAPGSGRNQESFRRVRGRERVVGARYDDRHWALVARIKLLNRRYSPAMWAAKEAEQTAHAKVDTPPGVVPMDPLKRWYKLHCG